MKYKSDNGKEFNIRIIYEGPIKFYMVQVFDEEIMGFVNFQINPKNPNKAWMFKIETYKKYQNQGIGKALLDIMEYILSDSHVFFVEGKYYPENQYAEGFYKTNGYDIEKDGYESYVGKFLYREKILNEISNKIIDFEILTPENPTM